MDTYFSSFKRTVHASDSENKRFLLNACLLSRGFQIGKVETKAETTERNVSLQRSSSKHLFSELQGYTVHLKEGSLIGQKTVDCILD